MTLTVRLPLRVEEELARYCVARRITKSEAVKQALARLLAEDAARPSPYALGKGGFGSDRTPDRNVARDTKRLLRERFRGKPAR